MVTKQSELVHYFNADDFNKNAKLFLETSIIGGDTFALVSIDCDNFDFINDLFSYESGDAVLQRLTEHFSTFLTDAECFSRLHSDHFVFLVNATQTPNLIERFHQITDVKEILSGILPPHYNVVFSGGIVPISEYGKSFTVWLDQATLARKQAKGNHEFEMYLQPKVLLKTGEIVGAEALVRWNSKQLGMIYPDRFIPILEQNGFIKQLDFFMLEQACLFLKKDISMGRAPLPISVNFSKMHLRSAGFVEKVFYTVNRHALPTKLIEIEVTENISLGDFQVLIEVASAFKQLGFWSRLSLC